MVDVNAGFTETTVVPAMRSVYFWRWSGPGVATPNIQSSSRRSPYILLMLRMNALSNVTLLPLVICTCNPRIFFPTVAPEDASKSTK